jgi:hypothetical protein
MLVPTDSDTLVHGGNCSLHLGNCIIIIMLVTIDSATLVHGGNSLDTLVTTSSRGCY